MVFLLTSTPSDDDPVPAAKALDIEGVQIFAMGRESNRKQMKEVVNKSDKSVVISGLLI